MNWTRERPTKKGWYWFRDDQTYAIFFDPDYGVIFSGNECEYTLDELPGEWAGPLEPPD